MRGGAGDTCAYGFMGEDVGGYRFFDREVSGWLIAGEMRNAARYLSGAG